MQIPYSVASVSWNHFLWVDLSALFDCQFGIDDAKTYLRDGDMIMHFICNEEDIDSDNYYYPEIIIKNMSEWWLQCQYEATKRIGG